MQSTSVIAGCFCEEANVDDLCAPIVAVFFSVQLFFIGLLGEYVLAIHRHVLNRPLVVEKERINF